MSTSTHTALIGRWASPTPETIANADGSTIYGIRDFRFATETWSVRFSAYGDAQASYPLFTLRAEGSYRIGADSAAVPGAHEADFAFHARYLTAHAEQFVDLLNSADSAGTTWVTGSERDISANGALFFPSVAAAPVEYDLVALRDGMLYLGDRSGDLSTVRPVLLGRDPLGRLSS